MSDINPFTEMVVAEYLTNSLYPSTDSPRRDPDEYSRPARTSSVASRRQPTDKEIAASIESLKSNIVMSLFVWVPTIIAVSYLLYKNRDRD